MATGTDWKCLEGQILDEKFAVEEFAQQAGVSAAFFRARDVASSQALLLRVEDEDQPSARHDFDRFREAAFLSHPNLVRVLAVGRTLCKERRFIYLVTEIADTDLAEALRGQPMDLEQISGLLRQVAAGLTYLHSENLVYCALRTLSIWRVGSQWKLADFTQLRVAGEYPLQETRHLMLVPGFEAPPEANEGVVSAPWDVWSFGSLVRKLFQRQAENDDSGNRLKRSLSLAKLSVPAPFDEILRESLDPDPARRATLDHLRELLSRPFEPARIEQPAMMESLSEETVEHRPVAPPRSLSGSPPPRRAWMTSILVGSLLAVAAAVLLAFFLPARMTHPRAVQQEKATAPPAPEPAAPAEAAAEPKPAEPTPAPVAAAGHSPFGDKSAPPASGENPNSPTEQAISLLLNRWAAATRNRNVDEEVKCYAPVVDRFYGQRGLQSARFRSQEENVFSRIGSVRKFEITNVHFDRVEPQWAVVSFDKHWDFGGRSRFAGSTREEMVMRPIGGQWKIASERELKVYWVDKEAM